MKRMVIAAIATAALTGASLTPAPVRASDDLGRFIAGAAALFILGAAISQANQPPAQPPAHARPQPHRPHPPARPHRPHQPVAIPARCAVTATIRGRSEPFYRERCIRNAGITVPLPRRCAATIQGAQGTRILYSASCLREAGFRVAHR